MSFGASDSLVDLFTGNLGAVLLVAWDKACAVAYAARSDPRDFADPPPASDGELTALTAAAVRHAHAKAPYVPMTILGLLAAIRDLQAPAGATPRRLRRRSSTGARRRSFDALSPEARFVSPQFEAARRSDAQNDRNPLTFGRGDLTSKSIDDLLAGVLGNQVQLRSQRRRGTNRNARVTLRTPRERQGFSDDEIRALKTIFAMLDNDGTGQLSQKDLGDYATAIGEGESVSPQDVHVVFTTLAADSSTIGLEEWVLFAAKLKAASVYVPA